jgi:RNA polymerase sigma-70 factor (ECF subfamily)
MGAKDDKYWAGRLVAVGRHRDAEAFSELFDHFAPRLGSLLRRGGLTRTQAEDAMQDVMVTVWRKARLYDPNRASVAAWLFTIARNRRVDLLRRATRAEPEDLPWGPEPEGEGETLVGWAQETVRLAEAVAELPDAQRMLIVRAFYEEESHGEIAARTGLPLGTVKSRIRLGLERLRHRMDAPPPPAARDAARAAAAARRVPPGA